MNVNDYYKQLSSETSRILNDSLGDGSLQGLVHDHISNLQEWSKVLQNEPSAPMLRNSIEELDMSCLQMLQGMYRSSFASLRLSVEMLVGSVFYSSHQIEYVEWSKGSRDLHWSTIMDHENGVLSHRFMKAYFPELEANYGEYFKNLKDLYRELSEMVHGNYRTWDASNPKLTKNETLQKKYKEFLQIFIECSNFILCLRFLKSLKTGDVTILETIINDSLGHVEPIRVQIGGPSNE